MADTEIKTNVQVSGETADIALFGGRMRIFSTFDSIDETNVVEALNEAIIAHGMNAGQIEYLWNYYRGKQPILDRVKEVRPEITNRIVENHAQEIVAFKIGYQLAEPLQYTTRMLSDSDEGYEDTLSQVNELNTLMFAEDKASCDRDLFEWLCVCGVGYRMIEADTEDDVEDGGAPFEIYTLDPRATFIAYSPCYHHRPLFGVWIGVEPKTKEKIYNVWTDTEKFVIYQNEIVPFVREGLKYKSAPHTYGHIPIIEYRLNNARMGVFEPVLGLLDAINNAESNRLDDIEQTVQSLMKFQDCDIDAETYEQFRQQGVIKIKTIDPSVKPDVSVLTTDLDQEGTQTTKDDLYQQVVNICGMPNRSASGGSTSDTGAAVLLRDGWTLAESHAKSYELQFKRSERDFLRVALAICKQSKESSIDLRIRDIELAFNRRNYENILVKAQVLTTMLQTDKIHPQLAFQSCGLFSDPDAAYTQSQEWLEENKSDDIQAAALATATTQAVENGIKEPASQANTPEPSDNTPVVSA